MEDDFGICCKLGGELLEQEGNKGVARVSGKAKANLSDLRAF
jgi:hypothetical protein